MVSQITQMDNALSTLLVAPGQCASHIPPLADEQSEEKIRISEPELLFLRWWTTINNIRDKVMICFVRLLIEDLEFCNAVQIEQGIWKSIFYRILNMLRPWIKNPYLTGYVTV